MRILLTTHQFFPDFIAGTEVLTRAVAREMIRRGHEVRVLTGSPCAPDAVSDATRCDTYDYEQIKVYRFWHAYEPMGGQKSMLEIGFDNHLAQAYFARIVDEFRPDVVHFFHFNRLGTGMIEAAISARVPIWFTPTDFWTVCTTAQLRDLAGRNCGGPSAHSGNCALHFAGHTLGGRLGQAVGALPASVGDFLVRASASGLLGQHRLVGELRAMGERLPRNIARLNQLDGIVAPNRQMAEFLICHGVRADLIHLHPFGIEQEGMPKPGQPRTVRRHGALRVGFIGTLLEHKGCHILLEALAHVPAGAVETRIYGSPKDCEAYMARLKMLAMKAGQVEFCGTFASERIGEVLDGMDVLVVPSIWSENTPLVLYSAQAAGCPVIASDMPGLAEALQSGEDGLLFPVGDSLALARCLTEMAADRDALQRLAASAPRPPDIASYCDALLALWCGSIVSEGLQGVTGKP